MFCVCIKTQINPSLDNSKGAPMQADFAARLRQLRDQNNWTVAEMAERTGIPKQTLDKYLLRTGASLPSFEGLIALSRGLGVSLDWLVLGSEGVTDTTELLVRRCAATVSQAHFEALLREYHEGKRPIFDGEEILSLTPEEWAGDIGLRAGAKARELAANGVTKSDLLDWSEAESERTTELMRSRIARLTGQDQIARPVR